MKVTNQEPFKHDGLTGTLYEPKPRIDGKLLAAAYKLTNEDIKPYLIYTKPYFRFTVERIIKL